MKEFSQFRVVVCDEGHRFGQVVLAHGGLEICERLVVRLGMAFTPVHEEADHQAAYDAKDPQAIGIANPAAVLVERDVQALMCPVLDSPGQTIGF